MKSVIYNYITTNSITGLKYVGMHITNNVDDNYLGSGRYFIKALKKYGRESFKKEIICFCDTKEEAFENEKILIEKYNTLKPNGYNLSPTGGMNVVGCCSEETKKKLSEKKKGNKYSLGFKQSQETIEKKREYMKNRFVSEESKQKMRKPKSEEAKRNMRKPKNYKISENHIKKLKEVWNNLDEDKKLKFKYRKAKKVINVTTGEIFLSIKDAAFAAGINYPGFFKQITNKGKNKTNFKLL